MRIGGDDLSVQPALGVDLFKGFDIPIQIGEHGYGAVFPVRTQSNGTAISSLAASGPGVSSGAVPSSSPPDIALDSTANPAWVATER